MGVLLQIVEREGSDGIHLGRHAEYLEERVLPSDVVEYVGSACYLLLYPLLAHLVEIVLGEQGVDGMNTAQASCEIYVFHNIRTVLESHEIGVLSQHTLVGKRHCSEHHGHCANHRVLGGHHRICHLVTDGHHHVGESVLARLVEYASGLIHLLVMVPFFAVKIEVGKMGIDAFLPQCLFE